MKSEQTDNKRLNYNFKTSHKEKNPGKMALIVNSTIQFEPWLVWLSPVTLNTNSYKLFPKKQKRRKHFPAQFGEARYLIPKTGEDITRKLQTYFLDEYRHTTPQQNISEPNTAICNIKDYTP